MKSTLLRVYHSWITSALVEFLIFIAIAGALSGCWRQVFTVAAGASFALNIGVQLGRQQILQSPTWWSKRKLRQQITVLNAVRKEPGTWGEIADRSKHVSPLRTYSILRDFDRRGVVRRREMTVSGEPNQEGRYVYHLPSVSMTHD